MIKCLCTWLRIKHLYTPNTHTHTPDCNQNNDDIVLVCSIYLFFFLLSINFEFAQTHASDTCDIHVCDMNSFTGLIYMCAMMYSHDSFMYMTRFNCITLSYHSCHSFMSLLHMSHVTPSYESSICVSRLFAFDSFFT